MYGYDNPITFTDPSGNIPRGGLPVHCQAMPTKGQYEQCVLSYFDLEPINPSLMGGTVTGSQGCYAGPRAYRGPGYLEGISVSIAPGVYTWGAEVVYDFATMQRQVFEYIGAGFQLGVGLADSQYLGIVKGLRNSFDDMSIGLTDDYGGSTQSTILGISIGPGLNVNGGISIFSSIKDPMIRGVSTYIGGSAGVPIDNPVDFGSYFVEYKPVSFLHNYTSSIGVIDEVSMVNDILTGKDSPLLRIGGITPHATNSTRIYNAYLAKRYAWASKVLRWQETIGW